MGRDNRRHARVVRRVACRRGMLIALALLALASCGTAPGTTPDRASATAARGTASRTPVIAFPQQAPSPSQRALMAARLEGTLALADGCLRVTAPGDTDYLILWPADGLLQIDGGTIRVVAADGRIVARVGGPVVLGGGEIAGMRELSATARAWLREAPPERCPGPYWLAHFIEPGAGDPPAGTTWSLITADGSEPLAGATITLAFADSRISGSAGCNGYSGPYTAMRDGLLTIPEIANTAGLCRVPAGIMDQERRYLEVLRGVRAFRIEGGQLRLSTPGGQTLIFAMQR